jgi:hypothetical protein
MLKMIQADSEKHLSQAPKLLMESAAWLGFDSDLCEIRKGLAGRPRGYAPRGLGIPLPCLALARKQLTLKRARQ